MEKYCFTDGFHQEKSINKVEKDRILKLNSV